MVRMTLLATLGGCSIFNAPPDSYQETDSDETTDDGDTDTDTESQVGDDTGEDTDTGAAEFDCDRPVTPTPAPGDCVVRDLTCGETFIDTTKAGTSVMSEDEYSAWFCTVFPEGPYDGSERIYNFTHPGTGTVTFELNSPCSALDLIVLRWEFWSTDLTCPSEGHSVNECEMVEGGEGGTVSIWANTESNYLVIVDGPEPVEDIFEMTLTCP